MPATTTCRLPLRMQIVWDVLEGAKDVGDAMVIAACRRMIAADRIGRKGSAADWDLVMAFAE